MTDDAAEQPPTARLLRVTKGDPTPDELAALVAVVAAASAGGGEVAPVVRRSDWSTHAHKVRTTHSHGPGGWRSSARPR